MQSEFSRAWQKWKASEDGKKCLDAPGLGIPFDRSKYLDNRLFRAFVAGYESAGSSPTVSGNPHE